MNFTDFLNEERKSLFGSDGVVIELDGGWIDIFLKAHYSPRTQSVAEFFVPENSRGRGIGTRLLQKAMEKYHDIGAQVSTMTSLKIFYNAGFRNPKLVDGSFNDHIAEFRENGGSLFMAMADENGKRYK